MLASNSNFYQVGASLPIDAPSYVQRQADEEFYQKLRSGKFCYVLNSRQMGKSSLRVQTMQRLQQQRTVCAAIDLTGIGKHKVTQSQWYGGIVYALVESCHLEDKFDFDWQTWWQKNQEILDPVMCLRLFIEQVLLEKIQQPIVIFVDEIDRVLSQDFSLDDFFALIRFFQNQRVDNPKFERLTFALLGVATPSDLITDKTQTPFNIGEGIELHGFRISEVQPLIKGLEGKVSNPQKVMESILDWTGGQPFLTQKLCKFMVEESENDNLRSVTEVVKARIIENWESQDNPEHLRTIRDRMLLEEYVAGRFLGWYQQVLLLGEISADDSAEQMNFRLTGLVVKQQNKLKVYNKTYEFVFNSNWVERELDKLRPYAESFRAWVDSNYSDYSYLLRGQALQDALRWADGKSLSLQDNQYIAASQKYEFEQAQRKTQRVIQFGFAASVVFIVIAIVSGMFAINAQKERQYASTAAQLELSGTNLVGQNYLGGPIEVMVEAMRIGRKLKNLVKDKQSLADYPAYSPMISLSNTLSNIYERNQLQGHKKEVMSIAFSPNGKTLASASIDNSIKLWNVSTGKEISTLIGHKKQVNCVAFSPDGQILASASADNSIKLWDVTTGKEISTLIGHKDVVSSVAFSPDGKTIASASIDTTIKLWDVTTGKEISTLAGHQNTVFSVAFSPDGKTLASGSNNGIIKLWSLATGKEISTLTGHQDTVN